MFVIKNRVSGGIFGQMPYVDFTKPYLCQDTSPISCVIQGTEIKIPEKQNWVQLLAAITEYFMKEKNNGIKKLDKKPLYKLNTREILEETGRYKNEIDPKVVKDWLIAQTNSKGKPYSANVVRTYIYALQALPNKLIMSNPPNNRSVFACKTPEELNALWHIFKTAENYKEMNMCYSGQFSAGMKCFHDYLQHITRGGTDPENVENKELMHVSNEKYIDTGIIEKLTTILKTRYANGYRMNSPIELSRLKTYFADEYGEEIELADNELYGYIKICGIEFEQKVYFISDNTKDRIQTLANAYFRTGARVIFYEEFFAKNEHWFIGASVVSQDVLILLLAEMFKELDFTKLYFGFIKDSLEAVVKNEIFRIWGENVLLSYNSMAERLTYIPLYRIKHTLAFNREFIWNSGETYTYTDKVNITESEHDTIIEAVKKECKMHGYASLSKLPLHDIMEHNNQLSVSAIHTAMYNICLYERFERKGKIVTVKGEILDLLEIMKDFCLNQDKCTLDELMQFEEDLTGEIHRFIPFEAAFATMVRISKDVFLADKFVSFDIANIDSAIEKLVTGSYQPLKSFTTFSTFPDCGQSWNLFLLESYCRRFSKDYRFDTPSVNSRNAGAVIKKDCTLSYTEIMMDAVTKAQIPLEEKPMADYLFEAGYMGRPSSKAIKEILENLNTRQERMA